MLRYVALLIVTVVAEGKTRTHHRQILEDRIMSSATQTTNFPPFPRPHSTWTWNGGTGPANSRMNWTLTSGPGNFNGYPDAGDREIVTSGTVEAPLDAQFTGNTIDLGGTGGAVAALSLIGDGGISFSNPTFDAGTV